MDVNNGKNRILRCGCCGYEYSQFVRTGLVGCELCYDSFLNELLPVIASCQGSDRHVAILKAKNEEDINRRFELVRTLEYLKRRFESYMREGNIYDANAVNKRIREIKKILDDEEELK